MIKSVLTLVVAVVLMITGTSCRKEDGRKVEPEVALSVGNKLIIGEWKHQQTQLTACNATTGAAKSTQDYDLPQINTVEFTADGKYLLNRTNSEALGGIDRFTFQMDNAGLTHQQLMQSIKLIGEQVIPMVNQR